MTPRGSRSIEVHIMSGRTRGGAALNVRQSRLLGGLQQVVMSHHYVEDVGFEEQHGSGIVTKSPHRRCSESDRRQQVVAHSQRSVFVRELGAMGRRTGIPPSTVPRVVQGMTAC